MIIDYSKYSYPIKVLWRLGTDTDPYKNCEDTQRIINNTIYLTEIPDEITHVTISGYTEIYKGEPTSTQFKVNYQNGTVFFNSSEEGKTVTATYKGRGIILIYASRVIAHNDDPDVIQTIQDMIDNYKNLNGEDLYEKFDAAAGHKHSGNAGDAPQIPAGYISITDALNIIDATNVEDALQEHGNKIGILSNLLTTAKNSLVNAINELFNKIGSLTSLKTNNNTDLVSAINENHDDLSSHQADLMPHQIKDLDTGKTYRYGLQIKDGATQFIYEEVV